jgi:drug/metabolite transporter (DMT)-like permease
MRPADIGRLVALAAIWGASFVFIRTLAPVLGPLLTAASRVLIAGVALILYLRAIGFDAAVRANWRHYLVIGVVNSALPFVLYAFAGLHIPASYSVIMNSMTPLFAALLSVAFLAERMTARKLAGLAAGAAGVALVSKAGPVVPDAMFAWAILACLAAAFCYAVAGVYIKKRAAGVKPMAIAGWSQLYAGLVLLPLLPFGAAPTRIDAGIVGNVLALALLCSAIAYLLYYRLIIDVGPTRAMTVTFLMPLFGMLWGALFLGEAVTAPMLAGCALIIGGSVLVLKTPALREVRT